MVREERCYRCYRVWTRRFRRRPELCPRCKSRLYSVPVVRPVRLGRGQGIEEVILPHREAVLRLTRKAGIEAVWVFGSVRRREATKGSDLDLLVRYGRPIGLLERAGLMLDIEREVGRAVDLADIDSLRWQFADQIRFEAVPL